MIITEKTKYLLINNFPTDPCTGCMVLTHNGVVCPLKDKGPCDECKNFKAIEKSCKDEGIYEFIPNINRYRELQNKRDKIIKQLNNIDKELIDIENGIPDEIMMIIVKG